MAHRKAALFALAHRKVALLAFRSAPRQLPALGTRPLCLQAPGGGSTRAKNLWDGGGEATAVTPISGQFGGPSAAAERFAKESTAAAYALQSPPSPSGPSIGLPENWWHGSGDAAPPEHSDMGTASLSSVLTGSVQSLWITELCRTMSLTFLMFWKEKVTINYPMEKGALAPNPPPCRALAHRALLGDAPARPQAPSRRASAGSTRCAATRPATSAASPASCARRSARRRQSRSRRRCGRMARAARRGTTST